LLFSDLLVITSIVAKICLFLAENGGFSFEIGCG